MEGGPSDQREVQAAVPLGGFQYAERDQFRGTEFDAGHRHGRSRHQHRHRVPANAGGTETDVLTLAPTVQ